MNVRLAIFVVTLLLLPMLSSLLTGADWGGEVAVTDIPVQALWFTALSLAGYALLANRLAKLRGGADLLSVPRSYQAYIVAGSLGLGWLALSLNHYADSGVAFRLDAVSVIAASVLFAVLMPAALATRAWLATFPSLLRLCARHVPALPALKPEPTALWLLTLAIVGLMGGVARPQLLGMLLWSSPLWLLLALQLLWQEHTLFSGLHQGDWQRPLLAALSGLFVGALALAGFAAYGGGVAGIGAAGWAGCALFGLVAAQLNELIASGWRGKTRGEIFKRKAFPIPVIVKKD
jgi:hypothetical protein